MIAIGQSSGGTIELPSPNCRKQRAFQKDGGTGSNSSGARHHKGGEGGMFSFLYSLFVDSSFLLLVASVA